MCELLAGWVKEACASSGGIAEIVVYNMENRDSYTLAAGDITALTMKTGKQAFQIIPDKEMIGATQTRNGDRANNSYWVEQTVLCKLSGDTIALTDLLEAVGKGFYGVIVRRPDPDTAGAYINRHYGLVNGMRITTIDGVTGQTFEEGVSDTINFEGKEITGAPTIDDTVVTTLLTPAA